MTKTVKIIAEKGTGLVPATAGAAGFDLCAHTTANLLIYPQQQAVLIPTGIRLDMSAHPDICAVILPRSGLGHKMGLVLGNGVGLIDSDYQGELFISAWNRNPETIRLGAGRQQNGPIIIKPRERIAQLVFLPVLTSQIVFDPVDSFEASDRADGGFGSTGSDSSKPRASKSLKA